MILDFLNHYDDYCGFISGGISMLNGNLILCESLEASLAYK